jgi:hypothetical protein
MELGDAVGRTRASRSPAAANKSRNSALLAVFDLAEHGAQRMHELITLPVRARWRSPPRCFIETHGARHSRAPSACRRICKVVCKVAILEQRKNPNRCSGFELDFAVTRAGFEPAISTLRGWLGTPPAGSHGVATSSKSASARALWSPPGAVGRPGCYPRCYPAEAVDPTLKSHLVDASGASVALLRRV